MIIHRVNNIENVFELIDDYSIEGSDIIFDDKSIEKVSVRYKYEEVYFWR